MHLSTTSPLHQRHQRHHPHHPTIPPPPHPTTLQVKRTAKAFLDLGKACLNALLVLTADPDVAVAFIGPADRKHKVAQMLVQFIRRLCGPECQVHN